MALPSPRRRDLSRLQNINTASHPNLSIASSAAIARKASLNALTAGQDTSGGPSPPSKMLGGDDHEIEVGDAVDVPGAMHGVVKFIGTVRGKKGTFAGVELSREYSVRGKNDGDVDGTRYFTTSVPGSGIFLPLHRATRRSSLTSSTDLPPTPTTPAYPDTFGTPVHSLPKFSQSVGPGARPPSPMFKPKSRQSLPRPESPLRKQPTLAPTPGRPSYATASLSKSQIGGPRFTPSPAPKPPSNTRTPQVARPYSRNNSRLGSRQSIDDSGEITPIATRSSDGSGVGSTSAASSGSGFTPIARRSVDDNSQEINRLKKQLEERDKQLKEQAVTLAEMESSVMELQSLIPEDGRMNHGRNRSGGSYEDQDVAQMRAILREKNDRISMLISEFDNHRADFRSTIDTLELASSETERVYEKRVDELLQEIRDLQDRGEEVENVATQLKQLEELVQELEEGCEDARRGEAEARGEVEFLRGEVERTRAELRREREKSAAALKSAGEAVEGSGDSRDLEQRDDEIRGLKAIIHSLSSGPELTEVNVRPGMQRNGTFPSVDADEASRMQATLERLEREKKELQGLVERKAFREDELEREVERLQHIEQRASIISNTFSDRTATQEKRSSGRDSKGTVLSWRASPHVKGEVKPLEPMAETESTSSTVGSAVLWCEICETGGHDILTCPNIDGKVTNGHAVNGSTEAGASSKMDNNETPKQPVHSKNAFSISSQDPDKPKPLLMGKKMMQPLPPPPGAAPTGPLPNPLAIPASAMDSLVAGKDGTKDANKWCAMCEHDGHDSINCSFEDQF